jgi:hypothetical protein
MSDRPKPPPEPDEDPDPLEEIQVLSIDPSLAAVAALIEGDN